VSKSAEADQAPTAEPASAAKLATLNKRREKRALLVQQGIDTLDLWLQDLIRSGLAGLELQKSTFWEKQAARLVDSQAPGLAARVRRLALIPGSSPQWPKRLLCALGSLSLLIEAYRRLDTLDLGLQADVRALIGWTLTEDEVVAHGDLATDTWLVLGQWVEDDDRLRVQRTWLHGVRSSRAALLLQFAAGHDPFARPIVPGTELDAVLAFWPGSFPLRALIRERIGPTKPLAHRPPALDVEAFLEQATRALARQPWLDVFPAILSEVVPVPESSGAWRIVDGTGSTLPLSLGEHWSLLALSGGLPLTLVGEWRAETLRPLAVAHADHYELIASAP
jgi:hypothetical protein